MTQVSLAIAALLEGWQSPKQLTEKSGRANPEGIRRDAKREATRRGLVWHEEQVEPERGRSYKVVCVTEAGKEPKPLTEPLEGTEPAIAERSGSLARPASPGGVPTSSEAAGSAQGGAAAHTSLPPGTPSGHRDTPSRHRPSPSRRKRLVGVSGATRQADGGG